MSDWNQQKFNDIVSTIINAANKIKNSNSGNYILIDSMSSIDDEDLPLQITPEEIK